MAECFFLQDMRVEHIPAIGEIERLSFTQPWPANAYRREILENRMAYYEVARVARDACPAHAGQAAEPRPAAPAGPRLPQSVTVGQESGLLTRLGRLLKPAQAPPSPELEEELRSIVGYAGLWLMSDEAHITTIAVHPDYRGRGVGELLLIGLIDRSLSLGARWLTLEVRVSNSVAQSLYRKYTFKEMGVRRGYYSDNREDALVMWTDPLDSSSFRETLEHHRARLQERIACHG